MSLSTLRSSAAVALAATAITGFGVASSPAAHAACTTSIFTVVWQTAGVYSARSQTPSYWLGDKYAGDRVTGPSGGTSGSWTMVWRANGNIAYMRDGALKYVGCTTPAPPPPPH